MTTPGHEADHGQDSGAADTTGDLLGPVELDPAVVVVNGLSLGYAEDDDHVYRRLVATIAHLDENCEEEPIGRVQALVGWSVFEEDLADAGDAISADGEVLGAVAADIIETHSGRIIEDVVLIEHLELDPGWRGHRLSGRIIQGLLDLLRFDPAITPVVLIPEPLTLQGRLDPGPERDAALVKLWSGYQAAGFRPWLRGGDGGYAGAWWRPFPKHECAEMRPEEMLRLDRSTDGRVQGTADLRLDEHYTVWGEPKSRHSD